MSIDTTNLVAQIQNRIDNLTGTETLKDLLILSKASEGLAVDRTDLDEAIETAIDLFDGSTDEKDLLIGSKSLPVTSGDGGLIAQDFTSSGTFTVPAGVNKVWITATAGGGSGAVRNSASGTLVAHGGASGEFCVRRLVDVTPLDEITVTIGAGGLAVTSDAASQGNSGGSTSFGSLVTLLGGQGGSAGTNTITLGGVTILNQSSTGIGNYFGSTGYRIGNGIQELNKGGAPGLFGKGGDAVNTTSVVPAEDAADNTGAGGGGRRATNAGTRTSGAGGSGRLIVEWYE